MNEQLDVSLEPSAWAGWTRNHWLRLAVVLWIVMATVLTVKGLVQPNRRSVYPSFTAGARDFWAEEELYGREGFYYGPVFALLILPFASLPDPLGAMLWNWLNIGVFFYALQRFHREVIAPRWPRITLGPFLLLTLIGSVRSLYSAQSNAFIIALLLLAAVEIVQRRWWRAAFCLALPVHLKIWPLAMGALLAVQYPRKLIAPIAIMLMLLAAAPLATHSPSYVASYYGKWKASLSERQAQAQRWPGYRDGWTLWETTIGPVNKHIYTGVQLGVAALVLAGALALRYRAGDERAALMGTIALWAAWQMLLGPGSERLTVPILAPAAAWLLLKRYQEKQGRAIITLACVLTFVLGVGAIERKVLLLTPWANAAFPAGVAVFMLALAWPYGRFARAKGRRTSDPEAPTPLAKAA